MIGVVCHISHGLCAVVKLQKEENGEILNALSPPETTFEQSGLGPGQEYEVKLEVLKNNTRGPPASKNVVTSKQLLSLSLTLLACLLCVFLQNDENLVIHCSR